MKKFSQKGVLLFAVAMALCAFAMPSMASAASWGAVGTEHTGDSPNFGYLNDAAALSSTCSRSQFTLDVVSAAVIEITSVSFTGCTLVGPATGTCTITPTSTNLPWTATAVTTSNIQIHGINLDVFVENHPGSTACAAAGLTLRFTGTLSGARWTGNGVGQHAIEILGATGIVTHSALGNGSPVTPTGTISDTTGSLVVN
jgi:hypothetical protein